MYRNAYQRGMLTVLFSGGTNPLNIWEPHIKDGYISTFLDQEIKSMVLEIGGTNVSTTYITCPKGKTVLGITMPFLVMIVKNLKKYFTFQVTILDETGTRRRFRVSNFQSKTQILPLCTVMPIGLSDGWNQIQFNLAEFTRRAYNKQFVEVQKLQINANIRLRRIYFVERLIPEDELPPEYKLYFPIPSKKRQMQRKPSIDKSKAAEETTPAPPSGEKRISIEEALSQKSAGSLHSIKRTPSQVSKKYSKSNIALRVSAEAVIEGGERVTGEDGPEDAAGPEYAEGPEGDDGLEEADGVEVLAEAEQSDEPTEAPAEGEVLAENEVPGEGEPPVEGEALANATVPTEGGTPAESEVPAEG